MSSPLRVAYTLEQCWHRVPGGTATAALDLAAALARRDDVELIGVAAAHRHGPAPPFVPSIPMRHMRLPRKALYESWHRLGRPSIERRIGPVDVVHATGGATPPRDEGPLVVTVHDLAVVHHPDFFTANGRQFLRAALERARERADLVLCPSQATVDDCVRHGFDPARTRRVAHGVRPPRSDSSRVDEVRRRYELEGRFVLFVGTMEPRKNVATLLAAMARLPGSVPLVLAGPAGWGEQVSRPTDIDARMIGFVSPSDLDALYAAATVFCYPSLLEGFGLPVLEAMARGTPVVTSSGTATEELVDGAGIVVDPSDEQALAGALVEVIDDPDPRRRWGRAGLARAADYTWERAADQTVTAYHDAGE